jgi:hypothetical protein
VFVKVLELCVLHFLLDRGTCRVLLRLMVDCKTNPSKEVRKMARKIEYTVNLKLKGGSEIPLSLQRINGKVYASCRFRR